MGLWTKRARAMTTGNEGGGADWGPGSVLGVGVLFVEQSRDESGERVEPAHCIYAIALFPIMEGHVPFLIAPQRTGGVGTARQSVRVGSGSFAKSANCGALALLHVQTTSSVQRLVSFWPQT